MKYSIRGILESSNLLGRGKGNTSKVTAGRWTIFLFMALGQTKRPSWWSCASTVSVRVFRFPIRYCRSLADLKNAKRKTQNWERYSDRHTKSYTGHWGLSLCTLRDLRRTVFSIVRKQTRTKQKTKVSVRAARRKKRTPKHQSITYRQKQKDPSDDRDF